VTTPGSVRGKHRLRPRKRLGQHFLVQPGVIRKIVERAHFGEADLVLEIGPGLGALTFPLAHLGCRLVAVEKDERLAKRLEERLLAAGLSHVTVVSDDILRFDLGGVMQPGFEKLHVIGNLPYNISSPVLGKLVAHRHLIGRSLLMFQREVADRLTASPGNKAYGALSVLVRYEAQVTPVLKVSRTAFSPKPAVDSTVVELDFGNPYPARTSHEAVFRQIVRAAFSHRRKTLINSLCLAGPSWVREDLERAILECGVDARRRAETLHMDEFLCLASRISPLTKEAVNAM
jgi:16S rRNA (adenine1518-N6/adenine1519-N6)-dimethyltransferase